MYDYLVLARGKLLQWASPLPSSQYHQPVNIGLGTLAKTLAHMLLCEWYYVHRIEGFQSRITATPPLDDELPPELTSLIALWQTQATRTRAAIIQSLDKGVWMVSVTYQMVDGEQVRSITAAPSDVFTQLAFHEVHHRAQAINILRQLGVYEQPPEELDYNSLTYARAPI